MKIVFFLHKTPPKRFFRETPPTGPNGQTLAPSSFLSFLSLSSPCSRCRTPPRPANGSGWLQHRPQRIELPFVLFHAVAPSRVSRRHCRLSTGIHRDRRCSHGRQLATQKGPLTVPKPKGWRPQNPCHLTSVLCPSSTHHHLCRT